MSPSPPLLLNLHISSQAGGFGPDSWLRHSNYIFWYLLLRDLGDFAGRQARVGAKVELGNKEPSTFWGNEGFLTFLPSPISTSIDCLEISFSEIIWGGQHDCNYITLHPPINYFLLPFSSTQSRSKAHPTFFTARLSSFVKFPSSHGRVLSSLFGWALMGNLGTSTGS